MSKQTRFTALLLAACLLLNSVAFPAAAEGSLDSSQETTVPTEVTSVSTEETSAPTEETSAPTEETSAPTEETSAPTEETSAPTEETSAPTEETSAPTEETSAPTEETSAPTEPSLPQPIATGTVTCDSSVNIRSGPGTGYEVLDFAYDGQQVSIYEIVTTEEGDWGRIGEGRWICLTYVLLDGQEPTEETTAPTEETTDPTEESTDPTEESTDPTEETSDSTEETSDPTEETTDPTEESTDPTEESTDPTEETTDPLTELHAQLAAISVGIQYAEIVPQKMSLTWWAMNCGKMQVDLSLVAENMLAASPEGVVLSEDAIPQELLYQPENNTLFLSSPKDLVYLSYVDPVEYQRMTLRFLPSQQENRGFYLIDPMDELQFSPLGSLEAPFRGKLIFQELTGPIQLDCPLFDALTDEVKIEDLILECRAEEPMEGGLLAKWVVHTYGGAEWDITLSAPEMEEDAVAILPSLVGSLGSECDVALELTNGSGLRVIGSGFLCTQMGTNAKFTVSGLSALPSVTGYAGNVGGLVGTMSSSAELTVLGDCLAVSSVTGSTNVGGLIGSAFDPVLSLPMVTGAESALVTGENAGGVIGSLTYSAGDHALSLSAGNLQINGRANAGGLVGLLSNENGLLGLTASAEGISFGSDALGCTGSLIGSYLAPQMVESLVLNGEAVADEASLVDLIGNVSPAEEPTDPTEESTDPTEETTDPTEEPSLPDLTEEEIQAMLDEVMSAEIQPGKMSLTWWAVACGKITTESIMAEMNGTATDPTEETTEDSSATESTEPTEEPTDSTGETTAPTDATDPTENTDPTDATAAAENTEATEATAATEATTEPLPTEAPVAFDSGLTADETNLVFSDDFLNEEESDTLLLSMDEPLVSSFSLNRNAVMTLNATTDDTTTDNTTTDNTTTDNTTTDNTTTDNTTTDNNTADNTTTDNTTTDSTNGDGSGDGDASEDYGISLFSGTLEEWKVQDLKIENTRDLIYLSMVDANYYQDSTLEFNNLDSSGYYKLTEPYKDPADETKTYSFLGLGSAQYPFQGTIVRTAENANIIKILLNRSLFNAISDRATLPEMTLVWYSPVITDPPAENSGTDAILASIVTHNDSTTAAKNWSIILSNEGSASLNLLPLLGTTKSDSLVSLSVSDNINAAKTVIKGGYLCGTMESSANLTVSGVKSIPTVNASSGNAGGLAGTMQAGAELTVNLPADVTTLALSPVTASSGNAGGLVGEMLSGAKLKVQTTPEGTLSLTLANVTASTTFTEDYTSGKAGGLVGYAANPDFTLPAIAESSATIKGGSAGGLIGRLDVNPNSSYSLPYNIQGLTLEGTKCAGGLYGELHNDGAANGNEDVTASTYSISAANGSTVNVTLSGEEAGSLIGRYYTNHLKNTLEITNISVTSKSNATWFGGAIGNVASGIAAYVKFGNVTVSLVTGGGDPTNFGGLIGKLSNIGHMVEVGTVNVSSGCTSTGTVGGLVGEMPSGVLYISDNLNSDSAGISLGNITSANAAYRGWILGNRGNTLVYTDAADWNDARGSNTNDTGVWGQVLRVEENGKLDGLLTRDTSAHTVSVLAISTTVASAKDFATVALRMQLDPNDALIFAKPSDVTTGNGDVTDGSTISISLTASINLNGTGLTGLTRDIETTAVFSVTITGSTGETSTGSTEAPTITLPDIKVYVSANPAAHNRQGLIGKVSSLTVDKLKLASDGAAGYQIHILNHADKHEPYIGMLAAETTGSISLTKVKSSVRITNSSDVDTKAKTGGIIGATQKTTATILFSGCTWDGTITDTCSGSTYIGGFLSFVNVDGTSDNCGITVKDTCTVSGTISKTSKNTAYIAVGGLICTLYYSKSTLTIDGVNLTNATIEATSSSNNATSCGGLLAYEWIQTNATIKNVTITNCTLSTPTTCKAQFGGLVYKASGYWKIGPDGANGIHFVSGTFTGYSDKNYPSSLFVCRGDKTKSDTLYMEVYELSKSYVISKDVTVDLYGNKDYFDELVGTTIRYTTTGDVTTSVCGIVSIATPADQDGKRKIDQGTCNTYKNQLSGKYTWINPQTRYYYNLDTFRNSVTGDIDTPEEMVVLSAWAHCDYSLRTYFTPKSSKITGTDLDLTGYSYYPIPFMLYLADKDGNVTNTVITASIENATITFDVAGLQTAEASNKKPLDSTRQHYGMHTGIFTDAKIKDGTNRTLSIDVLTLHGTVGGSAIINGTAKGNASTAMMNLEISNVTLDSIRIVTANGNLLPLLINGIESYTWLKLTDVTTTAAYRTLSDFTHAATSLIGVVGEKSGDDQVGQYIRLDFSQIALDGRISADASNSLVYNTTRSIFHDALFLKDFQYADTNSWGIYNFTQPGKNEKKYYTLGAELSNGETDENVRNGGEQFYFYGTEDYVYCVEDGKENSEGTTEGAIEFFSNNYLRYVGNQEATPNTTHHEMDINLFSMDIIKGCGTYSDPYIIEFGKQLSAVADVLNGRQPKKNWSITLNTTVLASVHTNGTFPQDGHRAAGSAADKQYKWNGSQWLSGDPGTEGASEADKADVITYLRNAYYLLKETESNGNVKGNDGVIKFSSGWGGLGSKTYPFRGVIVSDGNVMVHVNTTNATQFGGLIAFSEGSVVKNVNIQYDHAPTIKISAVPNSMDAPFFGGVVGWCIGGDTIIDGVSIKYAEGVAPTVTGTMAYLVPVGGYVGLVGGTVGLGTTSDGLGGGVVFRNISESKLPDIKVGSASVTPSEDSTYFYVNPYVGRVLDGYAITEGSEFINTDKNYTIPSLTAPGLKIENGKILVSDNKDLWLLSAIVNSGAGSATASAYANGKARACDYSKVGDEMPSGEDADEASGASPYLIRHFKLADGFKTITASAVSIELTGNCDMTNYGNGFRGIGGSYGTNTTDTGCARLITIKSFNGGGKAITLAQNRREYLDESDSWTSIGAGLFILLNGDSTGTSFSSLTLTGYTGISYHKGTSPITDGSMDSKYTGRIGRTAVGALAANTAYGYTGNINVSSVTLTDLNINQQKSSDVLIQGSAYAGGLFGVLCKYTEANNGAGNNGAFGTVTLTDCTYNNLKVAGRYDVGGFLGRVKANSVAVNFDSLTAPILENGTIEATVKKIDQYTGIGGLIGQSYDASVSIIGSNSAYLTFDSLTVKGHKTTNNDDKANCGGLIGLCRINNNSKSVSIQYINMKGTITIKGSEDNPVAGNASGLVGALLDSFGNDNPKTFNVDISNIRIAHTEGSQACITDFRQGSGLVGTIKTGGTVRISSIWMGSSTSSVTIANNNNNDYEAIGGLLAIALFAKDYHISDIHMVNTRILYNNTKSLMLGGGMLIGFVKKDSNIDIRNTLMDNCILAADSTIVKAGFLLGRLDSGTQTITGSNILVKDCTIGLALNDSNTIKTLQGSDHSLSKDEIGLPSSGDTFKKYSDIPKDEFNLGCTNMGIWVGLTNGQTVKLVGVSLQNCNTPAKDFGTTPGTGYAIRADYNGAAGGVASNVTIKPERNFPGIGTLTSDGISLVEVQDENEGKTTVPLAQRIVENYWGTTPKNRTYFNVLTAMEYFKANPDCFSTYKVGGENTLPTDGTDFPVLIINSNETDPTSVVMNYISILTNHEESTASHVFSSITAKTYALKSTTDENGIVTSAFSEDSSRASLNVSSNGTVSIVTGGYDNQLEQFTLLDVAYADPAGGSTPVYHLYIPVIVKKILEFQFWAAALLGTAYSVDAYDRNSVSQLAIGSNGEQVTLLFSFDYHRNVEGWKNSIENGENLLWSFNKCITLDNYSSQGEAKGTLPPGTKLTLVDRSNKDQAYFGYSSDLMEGSTLYLSDMTGPNEPYLCDGLGLTYAEDNAGKFIEVDEDASPTVRVADANGGFHYFRLAKGEEQQHYSITVGKELQEQYYLTVQTPDGNESQRNSIVNIAVRCPDKLPVPDNNGLPTKRVKNDGGEEYARFSNENRFVLGNFFQQDIQVTAKSEELMSSDANTIRADLTATITFVDGQKDNFVLWASGKDLYQRFKLFLQFTDPSISTNSPRHFADGTTLTVTFKNGDAEVGTMSCPLSSSDAAIQLPFPVSIPVKQMGEDGLTLTAEIELEFTPTAIQNQFESGTSDEGHPGITVWGETCLAYSAASLDYSSQREEDGDLSKRYYRDDTQPATLHYNAYENFSGSMVTGVSQLGVNGLEDEVFSIPTGGLYNVSVLPAAANATTLRCTLRLEQKQDGGYSPVNIGDYLSAVVSAVVTYNGVEETLNPTSSKNFTFDFDLSHGFSKDVPIQIPINLSVITGTQFETKGYLYTNYKVVLETELLNGETLIDGSHASDYIIYTNAKVKFDLIS